MIGAITINEIRKYFGIEVQLVCNEDGEYEPISSSISSLGERYIGLVKTHAHNGLMIDGYVKFNKVFLKTQDQGLKIDIFKKKQDILTRVNEALAKVGYATKMVEIILK